MPNPNTAAYPTALPTDNTLPVGNDSLYTTLLAAISSSQTSGIELNTSGFYTPTILVIDNEIILVTGLSGSTITSCVRGFATSTATSHNVAANVFGYITSYHFNQLSAEVKAICTTLGINLGNVLLSGQTAGGDLNGTFPNPGVATVGGTSAGSIAAAVSKTSARGTIHNITYSATPVFDFSLGNIATITLTGNVSSSTAINFIAGEIYTISITQDATGSRTFVWPTNVKGGMSISGTASITNIQQFLSTDGTNLRALTSGQSTS